MERFKKRLYLIERGVLYFITKLEFFQVSNKRFSDTLGRASHKLNGSVKPL